MDSSKEQQGLIEKTGQLTPQRTRRVLPSADGKMTNETTPENLSKLASKLWRAGAYTAAIGPICSLYSVSKMLWPEEEAVLRANISHKFISEDKVDFTGRSTEEQTAYREIAAHSQNTREQFETLAKETGLRRFGEEGLLEDWGPVQLRLDQTANRIVYIHDDNNLSTKGKIAQITDLLKQTSEAIQEHRNNLRNNSAR